MENYEEKKPGAAVAESVNKYQNYENFENFWNKKVTLGLGRLG